MSENQSTPNGSNEEDSNSSSSQQQHDLMQKYNIQEFTPSLNQNIVKLQLVKIFNKYYNNNTLDSNIIGDILNFKTIKNILISLRLFGVNEQNAKKQNLCNILLQFLQSDEMVNKFSKSNKADEKQEISSSTNNSKEINYTNVIEFQESSDNILSLNKISSNEVGSMCKINPVTIKDMAAAVSVLQKLNKIIWEISDRITELERSVSILVLRVSEAEKMILGNASNI